MKTKVGTFALNTSTGNQSVTGIGFKPKVVWFFITAQTGGGVTTHLQQSIGVAHDTDSGRGMMNAADDNVATTQCTRRMRGSHVLFWNSPSSATQTFQANYVSSDADGFTINITVAPGSGFRVGYFAISEGDITNVVDSEFDLNTSAGSQSITGVGFKPDFVFIYTPNTAGGGTNGNGISNAIGYAVSNSQQCTSGWSSEDNVGTSNDNRVNRSTKFLHLPDTDGSNRAIVDFTSMDSDGFTFEVDFVSPATAFKINYIAIKGGQWHCGTFLTQTSTGNFSETGVGFRPKGLFFSSVMKTGSANIGADMRFSIGVGDENINQFVHGGLSEDGVTTTDVDQFQHNDSVYRTYNHTPASVGRVDLVTMDKDGFTMDQDNADATGYEVTYFAVGEIDEIRNLVGNMSPNLHGGMQL